MDNTVHDDQRLKELQALPLERKIQITQNRIQEWYMHYDGGVYVSFSGGKDPCPRGRRQTRGLSDAARRAISPARG